MERKEFEEIYEKYGEKCYPKETTKSVQRCYIPYERKEEKRRPKNEHSIFNH